MNILYFPKDVIAKAYEEWGDDMEESDEDLTLTYRYSILYSSIILL